jgi:hypothetical protein
MSTKESLLDFVIRLTHLKFPALDPVTKENSFPWKDQSCHVDSFLESCYACLLEDPPIWLGDPSTYQVPLNPTSPVNMLKNILALRRAGPYLVELELMKTRRDEWRDMMIARYKVKEDKDRLGSFVEWLAPFDEKDNDLVGLSYEHRSECITCKVVTKKRGFTNNLLIPDMPYQSETLAERITYGLEQMAETSAEFCMKCRKRLQVSFVNPEPKSIFFIETSEQVSIANQPVNLNEVVTFDNGSMKIMAMPRYENGHFITYVRRGQQFALFNTDHKGRGLRATEVIGEENMNLNRVAICLGRIKE